MIPFLICSIFQICAAIDRTSCENEPIPFLGIAIMVKNERETIELTIDSISHLNIHDLFIFDTGSTDGTQEKIKSMKRLKPYPLKLHMIEGEFVDFATSRNRLLDFAINSTEWLLLLDSGDIVTDGDDAQFWTTLTEAKSNVCGFLLPQRWDGGSVYYNTRVIRNDGSWRYEFPVHEYLVKPQNCEVGKLNEPILTQNRIISGRSSPARWVRDAMLLSDLVTKEPYNPRALFYLANTYMSLKQPFNAIPYYERRYDISSDGWWEERESAAQQLVTAYKTIGNVPLAQKWAMILYLNHTRIEGLLEMARYSLDVDNNAFLCWALAQMANVPDQPVRDLFLDPREWAEFRWNLVALCRDRVLLKGADAEKTKQSVPQTPSV